MKKLPLYLLFALFGGLMFSSCKKDFTCECTVGVPIPGLSFDTTINIEIENAKKKQAEIACRNNEESIPIATAAMLTKFLGGLGGDSLTGGFTIPAGLISASCDLK